MANRASDDGTGSWPNVATTCRVKEYTLFYLKHNVFIRRGDQRHAALVPKGRTRPKQYRNIVWGLCLDRDLNLKVGWMIRMPPKATENLKPV